MSFNLPFKTLYYISITINTGRVLYGGGGGGIDGGGGGSIDGGGGSIYTVIVIVSIDDQHTDIVCRYRV